MSAGTKIKRTRLNQKLTVRVFASKLGVSHSYLILIESGERCLPKKLVAKVASALKLPKETVYEWYLEQELTRAGVKDRKSHDLINRILKMTVKEKESFLTVLKIQQTD